jgi:hypothetical protein
VFSAGDEGGFVALSGVKVMKTRSHALDGELGAGVSLRRS